MEASKHIVLALELPSRAYSIIDLRSRSRTCKSTLKYVLHTWVIDTLYFATAKYRVSMLGYRDYGNRLTINST